MTIQADSILGLWMKFWPFVIAIVFVAIYFRTIGLDRLILLFLSAAVMGFGIQLVVSYPLYMWILASAKILKDGFEFTQPQTIAIVYGSAALFSSSLTWWLAQCLRTPETKPTNEA